ncbi:MAG: hypothetical protein LUG99_23175 [Lachnospiraceae bacterium]|nr:hypothetical protein [Lachnospiraceae bacterium]
MTTPLLELPSEAIARLEAENVQLNAEIKELTANKNAEIKELTKELTAFFLTSIRDLPDVINYPADALRNSNS